MHELTGNREAVLEVLRQTVFHLGRDTSSDAKRIGMNKLGITSEPQWTKQRDTTIDILQRAYEREQDKSMILRTTNLSAAPSESVVKDLYMPRDRTVAVFQAAMDEFLDITLENAKSGKKANRRKSSGKSVKDKAALTE